MQYTPTFLFLMLERDEMFIWYPSKSFARYCYPIWTISNAGFFQDFVGDTKQYFYCWSRRRRRDLNCPAESFYYVSRHRPISRDPHCSPSSKITCLRTIEGWSRLFWLTSRACGPIYTTWHWKRLLVSLVQVRETLDSFAKEIIVNDTLDIKPICYRNAPVDSSVRIRCISGDIMRKDVVDGFNRACTD